MCWNSTKWNPKTATKDIVCYKVMRSFGEKFISNIVGHVYEVNTLNTPRNLQQKVSYFLGSPWYEVSSGYFSYISIGKAAENLVTDEVLVQCTIPKGSIYCKAFGEYVSSNIIINKRISAYKVFSGKSCRYFTDIHKASEYYLSLLQNFEDITDIWRYSNICCIIGKTKSIGYIRYD